MTLKRRSFALQWKGMIGRMMTLEEIKNVSFRKANIGGYRVEDVDDFIDKIEETFGAMAQESRTSRQKIQDLNAKLTECKSKEESIGQVLLNAQRQADSVVREAGQKAQIILEDAKNEAQELVFHAQEEIDGQKEAIETLKREVALFKAKLLSVYREHLTLIDALPDNDEEKEEQPSQQNLIPEQPQEPKTVIDEVPQVVVQPKAAVEPEKEEKPAQNNPAAVPDPVPVDLDKFADEILAEEESVPVQPKKPAVQETPAYQPRHTVSLFDEDDYESDFKPSPSRFETLKFGDDYDLKGDPDIALNGRKKR